MAYQILVIDGRNFSDMNGFYDEVTKVLVDGKDGPKDLDAFDQVLWGGYGVTKEQESYDLIWRDHKVSEEKLGKDEFDKIIEIINRHSHITLVFE